MLLYPGDIVVLSFQVILPVVSPEQFHCQHGTRNQAEEQGCNVDSYIFVVSLSLKDYFIFNNIYSSAFIVLHNVKVSIGEREAERKRALTERKNAEVLSPRIILYLSPADG